MNKRIGLPVFLMALCLAAAGKDKKAGKTPLPSSAELAAITARGKLLEEYDVASWHATDVFQDIKPEKGSTRYYIAEKLTTGWVVVFGRFNDAHDKFLVVYEATQGTQPEFFTIKKLDPILEDTDFFFSAAKGFESALKDLGAVNRPYNAYAIPSESGQFYVYLLPAQPRIRSIPSGAMFAIHSVRTAAP